MANINIAGFEFNFKYKYGRIVSKLRLTYLISLLFQAVVLYADLRHIGMMDFLIPFIAIAASFYIHGQRWYKVVDGRFDVQQIVTVQDTGLKVHYALNIFSGVLVAVIVHFFAPIQLSGLNAFGFLVFNLVAIASSAAILFLDLAEGLFGKDIEAR